jgi:cell shape-determining protein MreD
MISLLLATIGILFTVLFEHVLLGLFSFSLFLLVVVNVWNRWDIKIFAFFTIITGIALDVTLHTPLGFNLFVLGVVLFVLSLLQMVVPLDRPNTRYTGLFFIFFFAYFLKFVLLYVLQDNIFPIIQWSHILSFTLNSIFSVFICILLDRFFMSLRDGDNYEKLRLK